MKEYEVEIGGLPHTLQLSDADAERYGATAREPAHREQAKAADAPQNKSRSAGTAKPDTKE